MKKFLFLILICFAQNVSSQTIKKDDVLIIDEPNNTPPPQGAIPNDDNNIYNTAGIDVKPEFPGGQEAFYKFFKQNYRITTDNLKGKIYVTFIIEKDGSLTDIKILRDIGHQTGAEAIRILRKSPKWSPGIQNNKQVRVLYSLPITIN
ncbi:energy transducer TonB [Flavobacterium sp. C3NV]|uniref:energy transducer TonB n=1 Tax=Flavobacterium sp. C3NV TaxID=3393358 RepID=UPI00399021DF